MIFQRCHRCNVRRLQSDEGYSTTFPPLHLLWVGHVLTLECRIILWISYVSDKILCKSDSIRGCEIGNNVCLGVKNALGFESDWLFSSFEKSPSLLISTISCAFSKGEQSRLTCSKSFQVAWHKGWSRWRGSFDIGSKKMHNKKCRALWFDFHAVTLDWRRFEPFKLHLGIVALVSKLMQFKGVPFSLRCEHAVLLVWQFVLLLLCNEPHRLTHGIVGKACVSHFFTSSTSGLVTPL